MFTVKSPALNATPSPRPSTRGRPPLTKVAALALERAKVSVRQRLQVPLNVSERFAVERWIAAAAAVAAAGASAAAAGGFELVGGGSACRCFSHSTTVSLLFFLPFLLLPFSRLSSHPPSLPPLSLSLCSI